MPTNSAGMVLAVAVLDPDLVPLPELRRCVFSHRGPCRWAGSGRRAHAAGPQWEVIPSRAARVAAVLGEILEPGDLPFAFEPGRVAGGKGLDQAADPVADLQREVGGGGPAQGADVLGSDLVPGRAARGSRTRSCSPPDLRQFRQVVDFGLLLHADCPWSPIDPDVVVEGPGRVGGVTGLDVEEVSAQFGGQRIGAVGEQQRPPGAGRRERGRAAASSGASVRARTKPWPGSLIRPAELAVAVAGEGDRGGDRVGAADPLTLLPRPSTSSAPCRRSPRRGRARRPGRLRRGASARRRSAAGRARDSVKRTGSPERAE